MDKEQEHDSQLNDQAYDDHLNKVTDPSLLHIEPCPFCSSTNIDFIDQWMECSNCHATGPIAYNTIQAHFGQEALKLWNTRTIIR